MSELTFEQRVIKAAKYHNNGCPIKDVLEQWEENQAICVLAEIYQALGWTLEEDDDA